MNTNAINAKLTVLVKPDVKRRLEAEALAKKTTVGDLVRRRLDDDLNGEERLFLDALVDLGQRAKSVIAELDTTRAELERDGIKWAEREVEIRKATLAGLTERDRAALTAMLPHAGMAQGQVK
ncbi:hypothetical protein EO087_01545 [Dyella sp. M7H15-1]|uniref:hypothetical protein n=1 Tax=Dyella sp. M7H15-1 TaxID=2501295 RepID=UPI0010051F29|nr:hypothetical protein [Dyella sp. M7H15-1]QAU22830.1 hypothetical protein EO087_01545 [Dyella sp. M7H15-1]